MSGEILQIAEKSHLIHSLALPFISLLSGTVIVRFKHGETAKKAITLEKGWERSVWGRGNQPKAEAYTNEDMTEVTIPTGAKVEIRFGEVGTGLIEVNDFRPRRRRRKRGGRRRAGALVEWAGYKYQLNENDQTVDITQDISATYSHPYAK